MNEGNKLRTEAAIPFYSGLSYEKGMCISFVINLFMGRTELSNPSFVTTENKLTRETILLLRLGEWSYFCLR